MTSTIKPKIWVPGDWNAFFGFGTNILVNLLTLTALKMIKMQGGVFGAVSDSAAFIKAL